MGDESREPSAQMAAGDESVRTFVLGRPDVARGPLVLIVIMLVLTLLWFKLEPIADALLGVFFFGLIYSFGALICGGILYALVAVLLEWILRTEVVVGVEGILVRNLMSRRLLRYEEITSVEQRTGEINPAHAAIFSVKIGLVGGASVDLTTYDDCSELVNEIERRRDAWMTRQGYPNEEALARGDRSGAAWAEALRRLSAGARGAYRMSGVDWLWALLDDSSAHPATRTAAAVALYRVDDDRARLRLRIAAAAMASTETRSRLERVADAANDAALAEALDALDDEDSTLELPRGRRKSLAEDGNA